MSHDNVSTSNQAMLPSWHERLEATRNPELNRQHKTLPRSVLHRSWTRVLAAVAALLLFGQAPAFAATIGVGGACTLERAIVSANNDIPHFCTAGRGPDTIVLPSNSQQILTRVNNTTYGPTGLPVIHTWISIVGHGSTIMRAPQAPPFRIFAVARTGALTLKQLTTKGGLAPQLGGGGVRSLGQLVMVDAVLDDNRSVGSGGGVWAQNIATIIRSRFVRNRSVCPPAAIPTVCNGGGGFYATGTIPTPGATTVPHLTVDGSTFAGNLADENGGGLQVNGQATINDSTLADNVAQQGGAMAVGTQLASIIKERLDAANTMQPSLHAAQAVQSNVQVTNTILTDNVATISGGGIVVGDGSDLTLNNTVVSGNTAPQAPEALAEAGSFVDTDAFNTFGQDGNAGVVGFVPGPTDTVAAQPPPDPTPDAPPPPVEELLSPIEQPPLVEEPPPSLIEETPPVEELPPLAEEPLPLVDELPSPVEETPPVEELPPPIEEQPPSVEQQQGT